MLNGFMKTKYIEFRGLHFLDYLRLCFYTCGTGPGQHNCTVRVFYILYFVPPNQLLSSLSLPYDRYKEFNNRLF